VAGSMWVAPRPSQMEQMPWPSQITQVSQPVP